MRAHSSAPVLLLIFCLYLCCTAHLVSLKSAQRIIIIYYYYGYYYYSPTIGRLCMALISVTSLISSASSKAPSSLFHLFISCILQFILSPFPSSVTHSIIPFQANPLNAKFSNYYTFPYRPNLPFLISDLRAIWRSAVSARGPEDRKLIMVSYFCDVNS